MAEHIPISIMVAVLVREHLVVGYVAIEVVVLVGHHHGVHLREDEELVLV